MTLLWIAVSALCIAAIAATIVANRIKNYWIATSAILPVAVVLVLGAMGITLHGQTPATVITVNVLIIALATLSGSPLVELCLRYAEPKIKENGRSADQPAASSVPAHHVLQSGDAIGYLERFAILGFVLIGQSAISAAILAIKGFSMVSGSTDPKVRGRFIVGTLSSLVWVLLCAAALLQIG